MITGKKKLTKYYFFGYKCFFTAYVLFSFLLVELAAEGETINSKPCLKVTANLGLVVQSPMKLTQDEREI